MRPAFHRPVRRSHAASLLLPLLLLVALATPTAARQQPAADALRGQLALGYLQLELAIADLAAAAPIDAAQRERLNRGFDRLTLQFFAGNMGAAIGSLDTLIASLQPAAGRAELEARAAAMLARLNADARVARVGGADVHYLLHLPAGTPPEAGWPVVVAVHGAGGDERMFFGGYGAGSIRALADAHGVAVVTPRAPISTAALFGLVDAIAAEQRLDARTIALLGHSMGAGIVARAAGEQPARTRAVACLAGSCAAAGAGPAGEGPRPPVLVVAGAIDPLFGVAMLEAQAGALRAGGATVEFRRLEGEGHTLVVGEALPAAMAWLAEAIRRR
jgi:predicted esterase